VGGMYEAIRTEWLDRRFEKEALARQKELDERDKILVGVNMFTTPLEEKTPLGVQRIPSESAKQQIESVKRNKKARDGAEWKKAILALKEAVAEKKNVIPYMTEATRCGATTGEMMGAVRLAMGYSYDPMNILEPPF